MGYRSVSISIAAALAVLSAASQSAAQSALPAAQPAPGSVPGAAQSLPGNAAAALADKDAAALAAQRAGKKATPQPENSLPGGKIEYRAPVRREVPPQPRDANRTAQPPAPPTAASATQTVNPAATANATAASPGASGASPVDGSAQVVSPAANLHTWSQAEIDQAKAYCTATLKGVDVAMQPEDPIKQGECGSPVLFKVTSVGRAPAVELSPPVLLTCDMIASLDRWIKREVQPKARANLGNPVIKIETMSSYSCRNAYGRTKSRLSEHGKANAIDIAAFATSKDVTTVLAGWGPTVREQRAIAAKQEAARVAAAAAAANAANTAKGMGAPNVIAAPPGSGMTAAPAPVIPGVIISVPGSKHPLGGTVLGYSPSRLGGAKPPEPQKADGADITGRQRFLKEIHGSACKYFGTVLGPEANNAHKNHFHLDMAVRPRGSFCE